MRALHFEVSEGELQERHRPGIDRWDEMWEGELHMVPPPSLGVREVIGVHLEAPGIRMRTVAQPPRLRLEPLDDPGLGVGI